MKISLKAKYFIVAIIIVGSIGIWLPFILAIPLDEEISMKSIPINLTTFYISIYFAGCVGYILNQIGESDLFKSKHKVMNMIFLILLSFALILTTLWLSVVNYVVLPIVLALIGTIIALRLWWLNNNENPTFNEKVRSEGRKTHGKTW